MIKPDQIPDEVVKAAVKAWKKDTQSFHPNAEIIAAALNAWPKADQYLGAVVLPLPQEARDE